jgi:hypothetical protein
MSDRYHELVKDITTSIEVDYRLLMEEVERLEVMDFLYAHTMQMALQHRGQTDGQKQLIESCQSLLYDWDRFDHRIHDKPPVRDVVLDERDFVLTCDYFNGTYISDLIKRLRDSYGVFRGRFMLMKYKTCLSMHVDHTPRLHIPLITNPDCFMVVDDVVCKLESEKVYLVDTRLKHTAVNSSTKDRLHMVFCVEESVWG